MKKVLDHDPLTNTTYYHEHDASADVTYVEQVQDVEKILDYTKELANDSSYKQKGIKDDWYHFATVPNVVIVELKTKYGLDVFKKDDLEKIGQVLQRDYKKLLTVNRI